MLRLHKLAKFFGERALFRDVNLTIGDGARIGIVGPNGCGKSTLLKLMAGEVESDEGFVERMGVVTVCYVPQADPPEVAAMARSGGEKQWEKLRRAFDELSRAQGRRLLLLDEPTNNLDEESIQVLRAWLRGADRQVNPYGDREGVPSTGPESSPYEEREVVPCTDREVRPEGDRDSDDDADSEVVAFTNRETVRWNADWAVVLVSHDREFLNAITTRIMEIDPISGKCTEYGGNFATYEKSKADAVERTRRMYSMQQRKVAQLQKDIRETKQQARRVENSTVHDYWRGRAKKVAAKAKARETRLTKMMNEENQIQKPREVEKIRVEFAASRLKGKVLLECRNVRLDEPPLRVDALQVFGGEHVVVTGRNGSGKTTLMGLLMGDANAGGAWSAQFRRPHGVEGEVWRLGKAKISVLEQSEGGMPGQRRLIEWFEENADRSFGTSSEMRTFLHRFLFSGEQVFQTISTLSSGERVRLRLAAIMSGEPDVIVLDEPTNHLDIDSIKRIEEALVQFDGTLIVVTHDKAFREFLKPDQHWHLEDGHVRIVS